MRRSEDEAVMELAPRLGWLFGLAPLPARPAGAPVRRARCAGEEEEESGELSTQERARDRRARMVSFLRSAGRACSTEEVAGAFGLTRPHANLDLQALLAAGRVTKRVEKSRAASSRVFWEARR